MFGDDHQRLAAALSRFSRSRVVVSYYRHPRLEGMYPKGRWTHVNCETAKNLSHQGGGSARAHEVLIINGPSHTREVRHA